MANHQKRPLGGFEPVLRMIDPKELIPYKNNAQKHSSKQKNKILAAASIRWTAPIVANPQLCIISGHGRREAAIEGGIKLVPVVILEGLTLREEQVLRLAENEISKHASTDMDVLKAELQDIIDAGEVEITDTGFDIAVIDALINDDAGDAQEDPIPAVPLNPVTRRGDIWVAVERNWKKGDPVHRLGCGDSLDAKFVCRVVGSRKVDVMFTDSPYNLAARSIGGRGKVKHEDFAMAAGEMSYDEFKAFIRKYAEIAIGVSRPGAVHFHCMSHHYLDALLEACNSVYDCRLSICCWVKNAGMGSLYRNAHELIAVYRVAGAQHVNNVQLGKNGRNRQTVWRYDGVNTFRGGRREDLALHATVKNTTMVADALMDVSNPGDIALDLFTGSGATLLAATRIGRQFRGTEIEPSYVDLAIQRWISLTGGDVILDATDQTFAEVRAERQREAA